MTEEEIIQAYREFEDRCVATQADKTFADFINKLTGAEDEKN